MNIFSFNWWVSTFVSTLITMVFMYIIKQAAAKVHVPVVSDIAAAV